VEAVARQAAERLLAADPGIRAIVLFGSAAYAPDLARDLDLLVLTSQKRDLEVYLRAVEDEPLPVD
jgi:predicted nucleotidyltransferase